MTRVVWKHGTGELGEEVRKDILKRVQCLNLKDELYVARQGFGLWSRDVRDYSRCTIPQVGQSLVVPGAEKRQGKLEETVQNG